MEFVDSHAHLADPAFAADTDEVIERARLAGARALVCIATSPRDADRAAAIAARHPGYVAYTAGLHPHDAAGFEAPRDIPGLRQHLTGSAVAVGECGLDYHYDNSPREMQRHAFAQQLELAADVKRPVVVHTRDAVADTIAMVREAATTGVRGVLHCFTGPRELAEVALEAGWFVSFSGIITFPRFTDDDLIRLVPADRLLVESDSPYLAPAPHRGKRNEPAWVTLTIGRVAAARGEEATEIGRITAANATALFGLASIAAA